MLAQKLNLKQSIIEIKERDLAAAEYTAWVSHVRIKELRKNLPDDSVEILSEKKTIKAQLRDFPVILTKWSFFGVYK